MGVFCTHPCYYNFLREITINTNYRLLLLKVIYNVILIKCDLNRNGLSWAVVKVYHNHLCITYFFPHF